MVHGYFSMIGKTGHKKHFKATRPDFSVKSMALSLDAIHLKKNSMSWSVFLFLLLFGYKSIFNHDKICPSKNKLSRTQMAVAGLAPPTDFER